LINEEVIPARSINGQKIAKIVVGQLLASAYEIWPPEYRPQYTPEVLRRLAGITVEEVAAQLGIGRSGAYEAVRNHQIPAIQLPSTDRWVIPRTRQAMRPTQELRAASLPEDHEKFSR
jgi:excisionase family DNA binding protein